MLVFAPLVAMGFLNELVDVGDPERAAMLVVPYLAAIATLTWGVACTLVVGKRLLQAKSGRLRTSLKAVAGQARGLVAALLLTDILRGCIAMLWTLPAVGLAIVAMTTLDLRTIVASAIETGRPFLYLSGICLLLILPLLYLLRTTFAPLSIAYEKTAFRDALKRSKELTKGRIGGTLALTTVLGLFWLPGMAVDVLLTSYGDPTVAFFAVPPLSALFDTLALTTWLLSLTQYYKALGGTTKASDND